ncbi:DoxX family protein [Geobacter sp. FeAm09]|uniref:DoxX family protein n=1 Tax=Geobacter sp. FeAm09 TaxID=2597769 RepID=UPI0011F08A71|nr:DoxX family protein [Geobacter sp. FeAm09]QEM69372.1 DoxX family protein [Geobacter sp. FeAm09]
MTTTKKLILFQTDAGWPGLVLRIMLGVAMFPHGAQKLFGWFGGHGLSATIAMFADNMHIPAPLTILVVLGESLGAVGLVFGLLTRVAAFGILSSMVGAAALVTWPNGFFMNWFGKQAGEGIEYHLLAIAISVALLIGGGGRWSVDRLIASARRKTR